MDHEYERTNVSSMDTGTNTQCISHGYGGSLQLSSSVKKSRGHPHAIDVKSSFFVIVTLSMLEEIITKKPAITIKIK